MLQSMGSQRFGHDYAIEQQQPHTSKYRSDQGVESVIIYGLNVVKKCQS